MLNVKKLLTKILSLKPMFEYVGNMNQIHWSSWTATDDGIILADIGFITGGGTGYYYVKDNTANFDVLKITTSNANGTQQTRCFPVIKGHTYQVDNYDRVNGSALIFHFYKIKLGGGYFLKVFSIFSRLAERWWEYAESEETKHQTDKQPSSHSRRSAERDILSRQRVCRHIVHIANRCKCIARSIERQTKCGLDKCRYIGNRREFVQNIIQQHLFICDSGRCETQSSLYYLTISERGWCCA